LLAIGYWLLAIGYWLFIKNNQQPISVFWKDKIKYLYGVHFLEKR